MKKIKWKCIKAYYWLKKWVWCRWHKSHSLFYPVVWGPEQAKQMGIPYTPNYFHCCTCWPCSRGLEEILGEYKDDSDQSSVT